MNCECGADTFLEHDQRIKDGYPPHNYGDYDRNFWYMLDPAELAESVMHKAHSRFGQGAMVTDQKYKNWPGGVIDVELP